MDAKKLIGVLCGGAAFVVAFIVASQGVKSISGGSTESQIQKMAAELNKQLPKQLDPITRWDRVEAGPGKSYAYIYTISTDLDEDQKRQVQENTTRAALNTPEMKKILDAGVVVVYKYHDASGNKVLEFSVKR